MRRPAPLRQALLRAGKPLLVLLALLLPAVATSLGLRNKGFDYPPAPPLDNNAPLALGLASFNYLNGVGGVAFGGTATGDGGLRVVELRYDPARKDGERLQAVVEGADRRRQTVTAPVMDWQFVPVARFADGEQHACFTLFGKLKDARDEKARREQKQRILNYHSAFTDTLLGLRLFQADILILSADAADLPSENGRPLLGAGEPRPDVRANEQALAALYDELRPFGPQPWQSYVICDHKQEIRFTARDGKLHLTGEPYWYCWRYRLAGKEREDAFREAQQFAQRALQDEMDREARTLTPDQVRAKFTRPYQQSRFNALADQQLSKLIEPVPRVSDTVTREVRRAGGVNPSVYLALTRTMQYAGLFRHAKAQDPRGYARFLDSLGQARLEPAVRTPTALLP